MTRMEFNGEEGCNSSQKGESGFTMIEMIMVMVLTSILATFIFQITTGSLQTLIDMRNRKERGDDAVMLMEKICRETREAVSIVDIGNNTIPFGESFGDQQLLLQKNLITNSSTDPNLIVGYIWDNAGANPTYTLKRTSGASAMSVMVLPFTNGSIVAQDVSNFALTRTAGSNGSPDDRLEIILSFNSGSSWRTEVYPRNYQLAAP